MAAKNDNVVIKERKQVEELTLLLIFLTHWVEKCDPVPGNIFRAWKGYPFDTLDTLTNKGYIVGGKGKSKSIVLTKEGIIKAEQLKKNYLK